MFIISIATEIKSPFLGSIRGILVDFPKKKAHPFGQASHWLISKPLGTFK
jgi:hypothetical protein